MSGYASISCVDAMWTFGCLHGMLQFHAIKEKPQLRSLQKDTNPNIYDRNLEKGKLKAKRPSNLS